LGIRFAATPATLRVNPTNPQAGTIFALVDSISFRFYIGYLLAGFFPAIAFCLRLPTPIFLS